MNLVRPLRVALVSKATGPGGGASRMAQELAALLRGSGHHADHWVGYYSGPPSPYIRQLHGGILSPLVRGMHNATQALGFQEILPLEWLALRRSLAEYDLVHFHDLLLASSPLTVWLAGTKIPVIWTFHDCSAFTGGCIQPLGCARFRRGCGRCPQHGHWPTRGIFDGTAVLSRLKRALAVHGRFTTAAPSRWMIDMAAESGFFRTPPVLLPNGVDTHTFYPRDKQAARRQFGLPEEGLVVALCSGSLSDRLKGISLGIEALHHLGQPVHVLLVGRIDKAMEESLGSIPHVATGYLHDRIRLAEAYCSADTLLYPTLADNLPLTVLEAMACGISVTGFATGGVPEMVSHLETGFLARRGDTSHLVKGLELALDSATSRSWGEAARRTVEQQFSHELFVRKHLQCYMNLLSDRQSVPY